MTPNISDPYRDRYSVRSSQMRGSEIRALFSVLERPEIISLAGGLPYTAPVESRIAECAQAVLGRDAGTALQYGSGAGHPALRVQLAGLMQLEGIDADEHHIVVTDGAQQGLELVAKIFCDPGDVILTEGPTYVGALSAFSSHQADIRTVVMDEDGIVPEALASTLAELAREGRRAKFLYVVPTFQNPSGFTLSERRRPQIVDICREADLLILEDNPYALVRFEGEPVTPLRVLAPEQVLYLGTLSKVFSPGVRIGWILAPEAVRERLILVKEAADLCSSPLTQLLATEYLSSGHVDDDLELVRKTYRERRDAMVDAVERHFPTGTRTRPPQGGLFLWVRLPEPMDTSSMLARALDAGAAYVPGSAFYPVKHDGRLAMRLNFSFPSIADIDEGVRRLGRLARDEMALARSLEDLGSP